MDTVTLKADLDFACGLLTAVAGVFPASTSIPQYVAMMQTVCDNATFLAVATALINQIDPPAPATAKGA